MTTVSWPASQTDLEVYRNLHNPLLDRLHHQLGLIVDAKLTHQVELMRVHGLAAQTQNGSRCPHCLSLRQQFQNFPLPGSESTFLWKQGCGGVLPVMSREFTLRILRWAAARLPHHVGQLLGRGLPHVAAGRS